MRISGLVFVTFAVVMLFAGLTPQAQAVEEAAASEEGRRWEYVPSEDPGLSIYSSRESLPKMSTTKGLRSWRPRNGS